MHTAHSLTVSHSICQGCACHACPLPCMPPAIHAPCHTCPCLHAPTIPPAIHAPTMHALCHACPLPHMPPCHAHSHCHACPLWTGRCLWKHNLRKLAGTFIWKQLSGITIEISRSERIPHAGLYKCYCKIMLFIPLKLQVIYFHSSKGNNWECS